jgi:hypothetical protein
VPPSSATARSTSRIKANSPASNSITNYFGGLTLNDSGLYVVSNRVGATPITMQGGTLTYIGVQSGATVGTITLNGGAGLGGANTITVTPATGTVLPVHADHR